MNKNTLHSSFNTDLQLDKTSIQSEALEVPSGSRTGCNPSNHLLLVYKQVNFLLYGAS